MNEKHDLHQLQSLDISGIDQFCSEKSCKELIQFSLLFLSPVAINMWWEDFP